MGMHDGGHPSLAAMFLESCREHSSKPALLHKMGGKFTPVTYQELLARVQEIAAGLRAMGFGRGDRIALIAENGPAWAAVDWAILSIGGVTVPIYTTVTAGTVGYILKDSAARAVFAGDKSLAQKVNEAVKDRGLQTKLVVIEGEDTENTLEAVIQDGRQQGRSKEDWEAGVSNVDPKSLATIIYTSGTTGEPKGAELTHEAFTFLCRSIIESLPVGSEDRFLSFLPLAHVYERMAGHFLPVSCGAEIAYAGSLKTLANDIVKAQPTIILCVPRFLESVRDKILAAGEASKGLKRRLFFAALSRGRARLDRNLAPAGLFGGLLDKLVGSKIRERLGGRVRFLVSGGAALPPSLSEFYAAFGIKLIQGYGLTETAPVMSINHPDRNVAESVGEVVEGVEVKIAEDGEILMRGPSLMRGYHNKPEETAQAIDTEGWFHTGDVGHLDGRRLYITDRKKDIIVMANGKNVAPAMIESELKKSRYIGEAMAIGDDMDYIAALIVPRFDTLSEFCKESGISSEDRSAVLENEEVWKLYRQEVSEINKGLAPFERVKDFRVVADEWSEETGEITPTRKVKRNVVKEKYASTLEELKREK